MVTVSIKKQFFYLFLDIIIEFQLVDLGLCVTVVSIVTWSSTLVTSWAFVTFWASLSLFRLRVTATTFPLPPRRKKNLLSFFWADEDE